MVTLIAQESDNAVSVVFMIVLAAIALALIVLWVAAIVSVLRSNRLTGGGKTLWIVVILAFPFLGSLAWFIFGRDAQLVKSPGGQF
jgi:RsiW-degrading membrane proteinase PrsW (M82 family)